MRCSVDKSPDSVDRHSRLVSSDRRDDRDAMTVTEAARQLGVSPRTLKRWHPSALPYFRVGARGDRRYPRAQVDRYVTSRTLGLELEE